MKYYIEEHTTRYQRIQAEGKSSWDELFGGNGFEDASVLPFIEAALPRLEFQTTQPHALEYGCGTGPGACYLATKSFAVDGMDLNLIAIEIARQEAISRNLDIRYSVGDVCTNPHLDKAYDLIVDSFCLQSIVTDADRSNLFRFVREHLKPAGYYLIITAGYCEDRDYGDSLYDVDSGIVYAMLEEAPERYEDAVQFDGQWYLPNRRHCKRADLVSELADAGLRTVWQTRDAHGNIGMICKQSAVVI